MNKNKSLIALTILTTVVVVNYLFIKTTHAPLTEKVISPTIEKAVTTPHTDFKEISKVDPADNEVVITVDAGFGDRSAEGLLTALKKHNIKATFFLVGEWVEKYPELTKRIVNEGHEIFNHSYDHRDYTLLSAEEIKIDLQKMDDTLYRIVGVRTRPYYRAPSGARNTAVNIAASEIGFQHIYWSVDPQDWRLDISGETIKNRVLKNIHPGAIVLLHIADSATGEIADEMFTELEKKGYKLVSLTEGLK